MRALLVVLLLLLSSACAAGGSREVVVGAVYPTGGAQGPGGLEEYRGLSVAAAVARDVRGLPIRIRLEKADSADAAAGAVDRLARAGVSVVAGSYGSTISKPAAAAASRRGLVFWETGAVGELDMRPDATERVFRFVPTGEALGGAAVAFVRDEVTPLLPRHDGLRYTLAYADDVYGRSVAEGAAREIDRSGLTLAARLPYDPRTASFDDLASRTAVARTDVLVVAAYLEDGVALRRAMVRAQVPLLAGIGTSSSFCHPAFGEMLGDEAVGLFASDKPDGDVIDPSKLSGDAARVLGRGRHLYRKRHGAEMSAAALSGFAGGWALLHHVLPSARSMSPRDVARAARMVRVETGGLPNGSGLEFAETGTSNLRATSVIWEWVKPRTRAVVWPPAFATDPVSVLPVGPAG